MENLPPGFHTPGTAQQLILEACRAGQAAAVRVLATKMLPSPETMTSALQLAATMGHALTVEQLLSMRPTAASKRAPDTSTALMAAAAKGHTNVVCVILSAGCVGLGGIQGSGLPQTSHNASPSDAVSHGRCVRQFELHPGAPDAALEASKAGHEGTLEVLLAAGVPLSTHGDGLLRAAALTGHVGVLRLLLARGADPHVLTAAPCASHPAARDEQPAAPEPLLVAVAAAGHTDVVRMVIEELKADAQPIADTLLRAAAERGHTATLAFLISSLPLGNGRSQTSVVLNHVLAAAAAAGQAGAVQVLLDAGASANSEQGHQCLINAVRAGRAAVVELLLQHGASAAACGGEPLRTASWTGDVPMLQLLLNHGAGAPSDCAAALQLAANSGKVQAVCALLDFWQQELNEASSAPRQGVLLARELQALYRGIAAALGTALVAGAGAGHVDVVRALMQHIHSPAIPALQQQVQAAHLEEIAGDALMEAARGGHAAMIQLLVQLKAVSMVALQGEVGVAALNVAVERGRVAAVHQLIKLASNLGFDRLVSAAEHGGRAAVQCLLDAAQQPRPLSGSHSTTSPQSLLEQGALDSALCHAAASGHVDIAALLLGAGADVHASGDAALQWAVHRGQYRCARLLLDHGAEANVIPAEAVRSLADRGQLDVAKLLRQRAGSALSRPCSRQQLQQSHEGSLQHASHLSYTFTAASRRSQSQVLPAFVQQARPWTASCVVGYRGAAHNAYPSTPDRRPHTATQYQSRPHSCQSSLRPSNTQSNGQRVDAARLATTPNSHRPSASHSLFPGYSGGGQGQEQVLSALAALRARPSTSLSQRSTSAGVLPSVRR